ncbi:MAG: hypothetical protein U1U88_000027 [Lawsonella clevelandensis]
MTSWSAAVVAQVVYTADKAVGVHSRKRCELLPPNSEKRTLKAV